MQTGGCTYIMTNQNHTVLYTGVTSDLPKRVLEHKTKHYPNSFTAKYNCDKLVWFESFSTIEEAIHREKQIKGWSRAKKVALIEAANPHWQDVALQLED